MANAVFTFSESSAYDDRPETRYHFPRTYLGHARQTVGDWIVYYEPRRTSGSSSATGRQAYFATARVTRIAPDPDRDDHYYAYVDSYIEFDRPVSFRDRHEPALTKPDGSINKGLFGRALRVIPSSAFQSILQAGFARELEPWEHRDRVEEAVPDYVTRPVVEQLVSRRFRDEAFRRHVRMAYGSRCAISGLRLINGGGRPEVQAAHIRPVEQDGPDTVRNGLALTGTVHWLFDRGLISISDDYRVLISSQATPTDIAPLIRPGLRLLLPDVAEWRPHPTYLDWHRTHRFKG